jgi:hypothetical protein
VTTIFAVLFAAKVHAKTFDACGVSFSYPVTWYARTNPGDVIDSRFSTKQKIRCSIGLRPAGWIRRNDASYIDLGNWAVTMLLVDASFTDAASSAGFVPASRLADAEGNLPSTLKPGGWGILARQSVNPADHFRTKCCEALHGKSWAHDRGRKGEIESVTSEDAVLSRGGHAALIEAVDDEEFSEVITQIIGSFRFTQ